MGLVITEITIDDSQLRRALGPNITNKITRKYVTVLNKLAALSRDAYQSKVPVDTFELRDTQIKILKRASFVSPIVEIGVVNTTHRGRGHSINTLQLVDILNIGKLNGRDLFRTKTSDAKSPYSSISRRSPTAGWIRSARSAFATARRTYLSANRF